MTADFVVVTKERVEGRYAVTAATEQEARAKFARSPGRLINWDGVEQMDYMAYDVEVSEVLPTEKQSQSDDSR